MSDIPHSRKTSGRGIVDIVFLMDATGSMEPCIEQVKNNLRDFIGHLTGGHANQTPVKQWRAKIVGFKNFQHWGEPESLVDNPFTDDVAELESQIGTLEANGVRLDCMSEPQGRSPVRISLLESILHFATMGETEKGEPLSPDKWRHRLSGPRAVVIFTAHEYHSVMEEPCKGGTVDDVINACHNNRIILHGFCPDMDCYYELGETDKSNFEYFEYDESDPEGSAKALNEFTSDKGRFKDTLEMLAKSVAQNAHPRYEL